MIKAYSRLSLTYAAVLKVFQLSYIIKRVQNNSVDQITSLGLVK